MLRRDPHSPKQADLAGGFCQKAQDGYQGGRLEVSFHQNAGFGAGLSAHGHCCQLVDTAMGSQTNGRYGPK